MNNSKMCSTCGFPSDLCVCEEVAKEQQYIEVAVEKRRYGKEVTTIQGIDPKEIDLRELSSHLKRTLACGGTIKHGFIEIQGNHKTRVKDVLVKRGFDSNQIYVC
jgi:translation initiation factor 1